MGSQEDARVCEGRDRDCEAAQRGEEAVTRVCRRPVGQKCGQSVLGFEETTEVVGGEHLGLDLQGSHGRDRSTVGLWLHFLLTLHLLTPFVVAYSAS